MARIPQYNRSVTPQNTPYSYIQSHATPEAFGVGVSNAMGKLGEAGNRMFEGIVSLKEQYDRTKLLEFGNFIDRWSNENLYDKDNGYFYKTGKEAMGKSPELLESFDKYADEYISKAGFVGDAHQRAMQIVFQKRNTIEQQIERHDKQETDRWQDTVYSDSLSNVFNKAIQDRNNPYNLNMYYRDGMTVLDNYAAVKGWINDPEMMAIKKKEFAGNFHAQVLDAYLAEGSLKAGEYFEKHKESFAPDVQNKYLSRIHNEEVNYAARNAAQNLAMMSPDEAYRYIDSIENIDVRNATESEYNRLIRQKDHVHDLQQRELLKTFYDNALMTTSQGGSLSYDDIPADLDSETKLSLMNYISRNGQTETDNQTWEDLYNQSVNDAQGFAALDLNKYRGYLSDGEYKQFVKRQEDIKNGDYYTQIKDDDKLIQETLNAMGLKGGKQDSAFSEIRAMTRELEARKGRKINDEELLNITKSLGYKGDDGVMLYKRFEQGMAKRTGFIRDVVNDFTYYQSKHNGQMPPDEEKYKIVLKRAEQEQQKQKTQAEKIVDVSRYNSITMRNIAYTTAKPNEQKVLTYFADTQIPELSKQLGIKMTVTSRYRNQAGSHHSEGRAADVSMSEHSANDRKRIYEQLVKLPNVYKIGTSDPVILAHFAGNNKIVNETDYDRKHGTNHVNHAHITLINYNPQTPQKQTVAQNNTYSF